VHLSYIDDSRDEAACVFSALIIPAPRWRESFESLRAFLRGPKQSDGIVVRKELHDWKFVSGRGRVSDRIVTKYRRSEISRRRRRRSLIVREAGAARPPRGRERPRRGFGSGCGPPELQGWRAYAAAYVGE
jgi:hypothetical protein